jgi:hypothetical protein
MLHLFFIAGLIVAKLLCNYNFSVSFGTSCACGTVLFFFNIIWLSFLKKNELNLNIKF